MKTEFKNMPPWTEGFPSFTGHVKSKQNKNNNNAPLEKKAFSFTFQSWFLQMLILMDDFMGGCNLFGYVRNCGLEFFFFSIII